LKPKKREKGYTREKLVCSRRRGRQKRADNFGAGTEEEMNSPFGERMCAITFHHNRPRDALKEKKKETHSGRGAQGV